MPTDADAEATDDNAAAAMNALRHAMIGDANLTTMRRLYTSISQRDFDDAARVLDPDVVFDTPEGQAYVGGHHRGREAATRNVWGRLAQDWDPIIAGVAEMTALSDGRVLVIGRYRGVLNENGNRLDAAFAHLWTVRGGHAVHLRVFTDTAIWNTAWGAV